MGKITPLVDQIHAVLSRPRVSAAIDFDRVDQVHALWQGSMVGVADDGVLQAFESCAQTVKIGTVARNELMLALGRPVDKAFSTRAVRRVGQLPTAGAEALDREVMALRDEARATSDPDELRAIAEELETLCNVGSPEALAVRRRLIVQMLQSPMGQDQYLVAEVRKYLQSVSIRIPSQSRSDEDETVEHLAIVNAGAKIVSPALGADSCTLQWCRNLIVSCIQVQSAALASPHLAALRSEVATALARNQDVLASLERRLQIAPAEEASPLHPNLARALQELTPDDALRKLIERKARKGRHGSDVERGQAEDFLEYLVNHPTVLSLIDPDSVALKTFDSSTDRLKQVDEARASWKKVVVGQDGLRETIMHRLGTLLETAGAGYTLLFTGPPGVGKSMVAKIIASAHERDLVVVQGESLTRRGQLTGNEKMYVGTEPGAIATAMLEHRRPPVILIDELGKADLEAQASLATILDRDRNGCFKDVFLGAGAPFDLTKVIFIITANAGEEIDDSILNRAECFEFSPLKEEHKREIVRRSWVKKREATMLPETLGLSEQAVNVIVDKRSEDPGARQLVQTDLSELANWAHTLKDLGKLPATIDGIRAKRVVEQTWVDVSTYHDKAGFIADVRLGSVGLRKNAKRGEAYFSVLDRTWRLALDGQHVEVSMAKGEPVPACFTLQVRNALGKAFGAFSTDRVELSPSKAHRCALSPPLPTKDRDWQPLLENGQALNIRLVALTGERWVSPKAVLESGANTSQLRSGRYDV